MSYLKKGDKFGRLTIIKESSEKYYYECVCDCGKRISVMGAFLKIKKPKSCGCTIKKDTYFKLTHGMTNTKFYRVWVNIRQRCFKKNNDNYKYYGGRGIKVCDRWIESFENFRDDMLNNYLEHIMLHGAKNTSIDRKDNDGNYSKSNCRWATKIVQANNKKRYPQVS